MVVCKIVCDRKIFNNNYSNIDFRKFCFILLNRLSYYFFYVDFILFFSLIISN